MAKKYLVALDLVQNELQNARIQNLAGAPSTPVKGQIYFNSSDNTLYWWDGAQWIAAKAAAGATPAGTVTTQAVGDAGVVGVSTNFAREDHKHGREAFGASTAVTTFGAAKADGSAATVARSDHTHGSPAHDAAAHAAIPLSALSTPFGNVTAQTTFGASSNNGAGTSAARNDHVHGTPLHDAAAHSTIPINSLATATGVINMGLYKINSLGVPLASTDAATKDYVDTVATGLTWKGPVRVATTTNITLSGTQTIDGVAVIASERVLVKNQSTASQNGIYVVAAGAWARAQDANTAAELGSAAVFVSEGTTHADQQWVMSTNPPLTVDTTALTWVQVGGSTTVIAGAGLVGTTTFDVIAGDTSLTVAADDVRVNTAVIATVASVPPNARTITAGAGLTGGGDLSANRTLDVVGDASITVAADNISRAALTGDVTATAGANATTIANGVVTNAKLANMANSTIKGRVSLGTGVPEDMTPAQLKGLLGVPTIYVNNNVGGATSQVITHNLGVQAVFVEVYRNSTPWETVECDVERTTVNTITLRFAVAPPSNEYSCVVMG